MVLVAIAYSSRFGVLRLRRLPCITSVGCLWCVPFFTLVSCGTSTAAVLTAFAMLVALAVAAALPVLAARAALQVPAVRAVLAPLVALPALTIAITSAMF